MEKQSDEMKKAALSPLRRGRTRQMLLTALCAALIAVGAFIRIPVPVVPFTLQTFFVTLAGLLLGARLGALSALLYVTLGLIGLPIFAGGGGPGYVLQPSFGYLIGFVLGAYVTGKLAAQGSKTPLGRMYAAAFVGLAVVYLCGMLYYAALKAFYFATPVPVGNILLYCFLIFLPGDAALCAASVLAARRLLPVLERG